MGQNGDRKGGRVEGRSNDFLLEMNNQGRDVDRCRKLTLLFLLTILGRYQDDAEDNDVCSQSVHLSACFLRVVCES